jgi:Ser/Thr protein kinase RdoA (MazF antagonist)
MLSSGHTLKRIHTALNDDFNISEPAASVYPSTSVFNESIIRIEALRGSITNQQISLINSLYTRIVDKWEERARGLPLTIIHGDWKTKNQMFTGDGDVCAVLDFDFIQRKERLFDIAYAIYNLLEYWNYPIMNSFIEGYGPLTEHEVEILYLAVARISFFFLCTASFSKNAILRINQQLVRQVPIIESVLSNSGRAIFAELCNVHKQQMH